MADPRPTLSAPDDDPYLWLEEVEGARATAWVDAQSGRTLGRLADGRYSADRDALLALLDRPDNLPVPRRRGGLLYNYWRDAASPRGLWRRTTMESFRSPAPEWDLLLDLDALALAEGEDWVWHGAATLPPGHGLALVRLSRGGSDAVVLREFDVERRAFVSGGFVLAEAKGGADWIDADTLVLSSAIGGRTKSGYARTVRLWHRGRAWDAEAPVFETDETNISAWADYDRMADRLVFAEGPDMLNANVWLGDRTGPGQKLDLPTDAAYVWERRWLAVRPRTPWEVGGRIVAPDSVAVIEFEASWRAGGICGWCSSRGRGGRCRGSSGRRGGWS